MKKLVMKLLGLDTLGNGFLICCQRIEKLQKENEELKKSLAELTEKVDGLEEFDADDFVREDDVNDRIESYLNDNDYVTQSYCDDEIETKVSDAVDEKVTEAIDDLDIEDKVKEVVKEMDKASFGDTEELAGIVRKEVKSFMLNSVSVDFIVR